MDNITGIQTTTGIELLVEVFSKNNELQVKFSQNDNVIQSYYLKTLLIDWMDDTQLSLGGLCLMGSSNDYDISQRDMNKLRAFFIGLLTYNCRSVD